MDLGSENYQLYMGINYLLIKSNYIIKYIVYDTIFSKKLRKLSYLFYTIQYN